MFMPMEIPKSALDNVLLVDDLIDWVGPFYEAAEAAERAPAEVKKELKEAREIAKLNKQNQELTNILNSLGLYTPWQTPPADKGAKSCCR